MSDVIRQLEPQALWNYFADLNQVPRPSKKEERVIAFMKAFGENLGFPTTVDHIGNVIIKKPATEGMESRTPIVMQSHLDMVHQKNADTTFDFDTEGIKMIQNGDWVHADGTTLGADNGIGVATIMAILASTDIPHPAIDGCAGGIDITATGDYPQNKLPEGYQAIKLSVTGLSGGHSGMDIHKGLGNANKIMNRLLKEVIQGSEIKVHAIDGGGLRNAIPRESFCILAVEKLSRQSFEKIIQEKALEISSEYKTTDPDLSIEYDETDNFDSYVDSKALKKLVNSIYACPSGIYRMSPDIDGLVQTSNNLARVLVKDGNFEILCLTRSSVESEKKDIMNAIQSIFQLIDANVSFSGNYPGWKPSPNAAIVTIMKELYSRMFEGEAHVAACHAGLECGILGTNYPGMEMISFGPNIRGAHSPDEKVQISSVQKFWNYLLETLRNIPEEKN